jgi:hypothetical protein
MDLLHSRHYPRVRQKLVASIRERHVDSTQSKEIEAAISDLGEGGMFIEMPGPPPKGTILEIEFEVPGRPGLTRVLGLVRWREKAGDLAGVGVRFAPIGKNEHADIRALVRQGLDKLRKDADDLRDALSHAPGDEAPKDAPEDASGGASEGVPKGAS